MLGGRTFSGDGELGGGLVEEGEPGEDCALWRWRLWLGSTTSSRSLLVFVFRHLFLYRVGEVMIRGLVICCDHIGQSDNNIIENNQLDNVVIISWVGLG